MPETSTVTAEADRSPVLTEKEQSLPPIQPSGVYRDLEDDVDTIQDYDEALQENGEWEVLTRNSDAGKYVVGKTYFGDLYVRMRRRVG